MTKRDSETAGRLRSIIDRFARRRVLVLGDLVCDEFVHGEIARVSREAPVLILEHSRTEVVPGGGGNAVLNLRALDAVPLPVGIVGRDEGGAALLARFRDEGIPTSGIRPEPEYGTPRKSRILAGGVHTRRQQIVRVDRGSRHGDLSPGALARIGTRFRAALRRTDAVLVADYGYGVAPPRAATGLLAGLSSRMPVTVDSRARIVGFRGVTACTPNQEEVERALGAREWRSDREIETAGRALLRRTGDRAVLMTRGARGMALFEPRRATVRIPAFGAGEVADVTGAGDTVIAVLTLALASGATVEDAARLSNYAAGLVVMKYGTATVGRAELRAAVDGDLT